MVSVDMTEVGSSDQLDAGGQEPLGIPVDVAEVWPGDWLDGEAALQHPALHLLDPVLRLLDIAHLRQPISSKTYLNVFVRTSLVSEMQSWCYYAS